MSKTYYGYDIRVAACLQCGAPLDVGVHGGKVTCAYCNTPNLVRRRDDQRDRATAQPSAAQARGMSEAERLQLLRGQDQRPLVIPPAFRQWMRGQELHPTYLRAALQAWLTTRKALVTGPGGMTSAIESERLFILTLLLAPLLGANHERALLETAVDTLTDRTHRDVLRCRLAHHAALEGDGKAAYQWLEPVDPRPFSLMADTAYRLAVCYLALVQRNADVVFQQLGRNEGDVPIFDGHDQEALLLRCHAFELTGAGAESYDRLRHHLEDEGAFAPLRRLALHDPRFPLCPATYPVVEAQVVATYEARLQPPRLSPLVYALPFVGFLIGAAPFLGHAIGAVNFTWADFIGELVFFLIVGFLSGSLLVGLMVGHKNRTALRERGGVYFAHALSATLRTRSDSNGKSSVSCVVELEVEVGPNRYEEVSASLGRADLIPPGEYPVLFVPGTDLLNMAAPERGVGPEAWADPMPRAMPLMNVRGAAVQAAAWQHAQAVAPAPQGLTENAAASSVYLASAAMPEGGIGSADLRLDAAIARSPPGPLAWGAFLLGGVGVPAWVAAMIAFGTGPIPGSHLQLMVGGILAALLLGTVSLTRILPS
ncbi:MAG: hypothetical protein AAF928_13345 [Myxococcota bacterium]